MLITGRSKSGKTTFAVQRLIKRIWRGLYDRLYVICPTSNLDPNYRDLGEDEDKVRRFTEYSTDIVKRIIRNEKKHGFKRRVIIDINDIGGEGLQTRMVPNDVFAKLITISRWLNFTIIVQVQGIVLSPTVVRQNADSALFFACENPYEMKMLVGAFGFCPLKEFTWFLQTVINQPYDFAFMNRDGPTTTWWKNLKYPLQNLVDTIKSDQGKKASNKRKREEDIFDANKRQRTQ